MHEMISIITRTAFSPLKCYHSNVIDDHIMALFKVINITTSGKLDLLSRMLAAVWNSFFLNCTQNHQLIDIVSSPLCEHAHFLLLFGSHKYNRKIIYMQKACIESMFVVRCSSSSNGFLFIHINEFDFIQTI